MPRLKPTKKEEQDRLFQAVVSFSQKVNDVDNKTLAKLMGKTVRTVQNKYSNPSSMNMDDIRLYIKALKLTNEQIIQLVGGGNE